MSRVIVGSGAQNTEGSAVWFGMLGPLLATREGAELPVRGRMLRLLLVTLLLEAGRPVSAERLVSVLWERDAPPTARASLCNRVHALRRALGDVKGRLVVTSADGYRVDSGPGNLDVRMFEDRLRQGRAAHRREVWGVAAAELRSALSLWRGEPLPDLQGNASLGEAALRWSELRLQALEWRIESDMGLGRQRDVLAELSELVVAHPLRECFSWLLMLAYYRCGRQAEALAVYRGARRALVDELGAEPGSQLRELHQRILAGDPALLPASPAVLGAAARAPDAAPVPAQLPAGIGDFTGRDSEIRHLVEALRAELAPSAAGAIAIAAVTGTGGIGKTMLAVHVAHKVIAEFPDGQVYINLRGTAERPANPSAVLDRLLRDLGTDATAIPADDDERAARYRSLLAGRRVLLLLDDVRDTSQIRPLLPGSPGCAVVVTSRFRLADLPLSARLNLDVLPVGDARRFFTELIGPDRADAEPDAVDEVLRGCAGLPLAVRIAGGRLASRSSGTVRMLADRLASERTRLDELHAGDLAIRATFQLSYDGLARSGARSDVAAARAFRFLGFARLPDVSLPAVAALLDWPAPDTEKILERLVEANLIQPTAPGRYRQHELIGIFASELSAQRETAQEQANAIRRLLGWYLRGARNVRRHLRTGPGLSLAGIPVPVMPAGHDFTGKREALAWYHAEGPSFLPLLGLAARHGLSGPGRELAVALWSGHHYSRMGHCLQGTGLGRLPGFAGRA